MGVGASISVVLINWEVGSLGVGAGLYMYDVVVKKFTFAISSPDEFLVAILAATFLSMEVAKTICQSGEYWKSSNSLWKREQETHQEMR